MNREDNKICNNKKLFASDLLEIILIIAKCKYKNIYYYEMNYIK